MCSRYSSLSLYLTALLVVFAAVPSWSNSDPIGSCRQGGSCNAVAEAGFSTLTSCCNNPSRSFTEGGGEGCINCSGYNYRTQATLQLNASRFAANGEVIGVSCRFSTPLMFGGHDIDSYPVYKLSVRAGDKLLESSIGSGFGSTTVRFNTTIDLCPPSSRKIQCRSDFVGILLSNDSSLLKSSTQTILVGDNAPFEWVAQPANLTVCPGNNAHLYCHFNGTADSIYWDVGEERSSVCSLTEGYERAPTGLHIWNITSEMDGTTIGCHVDTGLGSIHDSRNATITVLEDDDPVCLPVTTAPVTTDKPADSARSLYALYSLLVLLPAPVAIGCGIYFYKARRT